MKIHEIRELKDDELIKQIAEEQKNILDLRFAHQLKQLTNTAKIKLTKRDIAKLKTELSARQQAKKVSAAKENKEGVNA
ncbi:MAG: 50S ribosomal protein L29 [Ignavibacteriaceae bacterium]|nr:50S ribosomal protein L29 [Ignavibacteriaceae bacterium]